MLIPITVLLTKITDLGEIARNKGIDFVSLSYQI